MEMDYNQKKIMQFFQVLHVHFGEFAKTDIQLLEKPVNFFLLVNNFEQFHVREKVPC